MTTFEVFLWGLSGSIAVDVVTASQFYHSGEITLPERYYKFGFYLIRGMLSIVAGGLAVAYEIDKAILAANIGAATPLIIQAFAQGVGGISAQQQQSPAPSNYCHQQMANNSFKADGLQPRP